MIKTVTPAQRTVPRLDQCQRHRNRLIVPVLANLLVHGDLVKVHSAQVGRKDNAVVIFQPSELFRLSPAPRPIGPKEFRALSEEIAVDCEAVAVRFGAVVLMEHGLVVVSSMGNWCSWRLLWLAYKRESTKRKRDEEKRR